jgi:hypothetical protein
MTTTTVTETPGTKFGNGFYVGLGGGANFPQNELNRVYDVGPSANLQLGYDPQTAPIGLRLNLGYNRLNGTTLATTGTTTLEAASSNLYSALLDAKLRLPFGRLFGATSGLYAVGGGGVTYFQDYQRFEAVSGTPVGGSVVTSRLANSGDATRFAANGGVGPGLRHRRRVAVRRGALRAGVHPRPGQQLHPGDARACAAHALERHAVRRHPAP